MLLVGVSNSVPITKLNKLWKKKKKKVVFLIFLGQNMTYYRLSLVVQVGKIYRFHNWGLAGIDHVTYSELYLATMYWLLCIWKV